MHSYVYTNTNTLVSLAVIFSLVFLFSSYLDNNLCKVWLFYLSITTIETSINIYHGAVNVKTDVCVPCNHVKKIVETIRFWCKQCSSFFANWINLKNCSTARFLGYSAPYWSNSLYRRTSFHFFLN